MMDENIRRDIFVGPDIRRPDTWSSGFGARRISGIQPNPNITFITSANNKGSSLMKTINISEL